MKWVLFICIAAAVVAALCLAGCVWCLLEMTARLREFNDARGGQGR